MSRNTRFQPGNPGIRKSFGAILLSVLGAALPGQGAESVKAKTPEALWEISRNHLKNPFQWPSVWKATPQSKDPAALVGLRKRDFAPEIPAYAAEKSQPPAAKNDWRTKEEKRTRNYLQKVGPLQENLRIDLPDDQPPIAQARWEGKPLHYLASTLILSTPYIAEPKGGMMYPGECRLQYNSANESGILQLYDEVVLTVGKESGVKAGDLYRTYEVGEDYRSFTTGRGLGRLVETNGIVEIVRVGARNSVGKLVKCYSTLSRETRASPLQPAMEVAATHYAPLADARLSAQVVWVTEQQQLPQPYSFAIVDQGTRKGFHVGDMVLFFNRSGGRMTEKVLGNGLVVSLKDETCTVLINDLYPGIINRGDYIVAIQTPVL